MSNRIVAIELNEVNMFLIWLTLGISIGVAISDLISQGAFVQILMALVLIISSIGILTTVIDRK